jgi:hypothetical protein
MAQMSHALARLKHQLLIDLPMADHVNQLLKDSGLVWRERLLPPLVMLRLFMMQILNGNCAIAALRQLSGIDFCPSSYCEARIKLPLQVLQSLLHLIHQQAGQSLIAARTLGQRILIADGSTYSVRDTPELRAHFDLPAGVKEGVGYPMGKLMGLLDAATGMFIRLLALPLFQHDLRSIIRLHSLLQAGDILLGDRAFCSFAHIALLNARGVLGCFRLHQRRKNLSPGLQRWKKPDSRPAWMTPEQFLLMPAWVDVRLVAYTIQQKGYRTQQVFVATTMLDKDRWPDASIAELYGSRWQIETCFGHLKTTMKMFCLKCETVDGVKKELAMYLIVYNLVRLAMLQAAARQQVNVARISFMDALRWLLARIMGLQGVNRLIVNPNRSGRSQLRVIRRRLKEYDLLKKSRRAKEKETAENAAKIA